MPSETQAHIQLTATLTEQRRLVAELDVDSVRSLLPRFEAKIQRVLDRVWGEGSVAGE